MYPTLFTRLASAWPVSLTMFFIDVAYVKHRMPNSSNKVKASATRFEMAMLLIY